MLKRFARKNYSNEEGFSLIEIVLIIIIIGVLIGLAVPFLAGQKQAAIRTGVKADIRNTVTAINTMFVQNPTALQPRGATTGLFYDVRDKIMTGKLQSDKNTEIGIVTSVDYGIPPRIYTAVVGDISWKQYAVIAINREAGVFYGYDSSYGAISVIYEEKTQNLINTLF